MRFKFLFFLFFNNLFIVHLTLHIDLSGILNHFFLFYWCHISTLNQILHLIILIYLLNTFSSFLLLNLGLLFVLFTPSWDDLGRLLLLIRFLVVHRSVLRTEWFAFLEVRVVEVCVYWLHLVVLRRVLFGLGLSHLIFSDAKRVVYDRLGVNRGLVWKERHVDHHLLVDEHLGRNPYHEVFTTSEVFQKHIFKVSEFYLVRGLI